MSRVSKFAMGLAIATLLTLTACEPTGSTQPFYTEKDKIYRPTLTGEWYGVGGEGPISFTFTEAQDHKTYKVTATSMGRSSETDAVLWKLGESEFLDFAPSSYEAPFDHTREFFANGLRTHLVFRVKHEGDVLRLWYLDDDWVSHEVPGDQLVRANDDMIPKLVMTLSTEELQKVLLSALSDPKAFPLETRLNRKDSEAMYDDLLGFGSSVAGQGYLEAGLYEKAASAWKAYVDVQPAVPDGHYKLGLALLATNQGLQAREEFGEQARRCHEMKPEVREGAIFIGNEGSSNCQDLWMDEQEKHFGASEHSRLGFTYFVEGKWADASKETEQYLRLVAEPNPEVVLRQSLTLTQLGKTKEATALLDAHAARLAEVWNQSLTMQYLQGQIAESDFLEKVQKQPLMLQRWDYFYIGSHSHLAGNRQKARDWFHRTLGTGEFLTFACVAAHARLGQLESK